MIVLVEIDGQLLGRIIDLKEKNSKSLNVVITALLTDGCSLYEDLEEYKQEQKQK